jgi:autotransporter-associated beta strand protein
MILVRRLWTSSLEQVVRLSIAAAILWTAFAASAQTVHVKSGWAVNGSEPYVLQELILGDFPNSPLQISIDGSGTLAFTNVNAPPEMRSDDTIFSPDVVVNVKVALNDELKMTVEGGGDAASTWYFNNEISGPGGLYTAASGGRGLVYFSGSSPNTYAGLTTVNGGWLYLNKADSVVAVPGDLIVNRIGIQDIGRSGRVYVLQDNQIAATSSVTLNGGTLYLQGGDQTLTNIAFTGNNIPNFELYGGDVQISPAQKLTLTNGVTRNGVGGPSVIAGGTLDLAGGARTFHVDLPNDPRFDATTLTVSSRIINGSLEKTGLGEIVLSGDNTYAGDTLITAGRLRLTGSLLFDVRDGGASNRITGSAMADLRGLFKIDASSLTDNAGVWNLVDVGNLNEVYGAGFNLQFAGGPTFTDVGGGLYKSGRWTFSTADGNLALAVPEPATLSLLAFASSMAFLATRRCS